MTGEHHWGDPPDRKDLSPREVHVWRARLDQPASLIENLRLLLAPDELTRAERFIFAKDRDAFIIARGLLRTILASYLSTEPALLSFSYTVYGKPRILTTEGREPITFNLSHSHDLVVFAMTQGRHIGIDIERIRPIANAEQIAEHFFSGEELRAFQALPAHSKQEAFFTCWTRKEAYIKARGLGLSLPLDQFSVTLVPGEPVRLLLTQDLSGDAIWSFWDLAPGTGYSGSLAVEGNDLQVKYWQWKG